MLHSMNRTLSNSTDTIRNVYKTVALVFRLAPAASIFKMLQQMLSSIAGSACLLSLQMLIDSLSSGAMTASTIAETVFWAILLSVFTLISDNINYFGAHQTISIQKAINEKLNEEIISKLMSLDYPIFERPKYCDLFHRLEGDPAFRIVFVFQGFLDVVASIIGAVGLSVILYQGSWMLSFGLFITLALLIYIESKAAERRSYVLRRQSSSERRLDYLEHLFCSKEFIAENSFGANARGCINEWRGAVSHIIKERVHNLRIVAILYSFNAGILLLWISAVMGFAGLALVNARISLGIFVALVGSIKTMVGVKQSLAKAFRNMTGFQRETETINGLMDIPGDRDKKKTRGPDHNRDTPSKAFIEFDDVTFSYEDSDRAVIKNISFSIAFGEKVAIVGDNGVGKSTIIKLLAGLYEPDSGEIKIHAGDDSSESNQTDAISFVFQDFAKYFLTLRQNVALSHIDNISNDDAINSALKTVRMQKALDLDQPLGKLESTGVDLSGGEWQRVALARAFFKPHHFIVFDEPTASLDPKLEKDMYELLLSSLGTNGCLLISHRLASARLCDRIIVLSEQGIEEMGNHDELMKKQGLYYRRFERQAEWYRNE